MFSRALLYRCTFAGVATVRKKSRFRVPFGSTMPRKPVLHVGKRGGVYYIRNGNKVYVGKKSRRRVRYSTSPFGGSIAPTSGELTHYYAKKLKIEKAKAKSKQPKRTPIPLA